MFLPAILAFAARSLGSLGSGLHHRLTQNIFEWWQRISDMVGKEAKRGLNSVIILGAWTIWTVRNGVVFNGVLPRVSQAITITLARDEAELWLLAGVKGSLLVAISLARQ